MLSVDDLAEIRRLHRAEGLSIRAMARVPGVSRNTVRNALQADGPPRYQRRPAGSIVDAAWPCYRVTQLDSQALLSVADQQTSRLRAHNTNPAGGDPWVLTNPRPGPRLGRQGLPLPRAG